MSLFTVAVLVLSFAGAADIGDKSDMEAYFEEIRSSGMSEMGRSGVITVARIRVGSTILEYRRDEASGQYWPGYMSATCPRPDADTEEISRWKIRIRSDAELEMDRLQPFADADKSGFVSTKEGMEFRRLVEFGYLVSQVAKEEDDSPETLCRATGKSPADLESTLLAYTELAAAIEAAGLNPLPVIAVAGD